ncbi:MAG: ester cyclase [Ottowia sp.]
MTAIDIKTFPVRYMEEAFNQRKFEVLDEIFSAELMQRIGPSVVPFLTAFPDWHGTVDDIIAEGDTVVNRWTGHGTHLVELMGIPATGKPVTLTGITIFRVAGDKIVEEWTEMNQMSLMQQLGVIPSQS